MRIPTQLRLTAELDTALRTYAREVGQPMAAVVVEAVEQAATLRPDTSTGRKVARLDVALPETVVARLDSAKESESTSINALVSGALRRYLQQK